MAKQEKTLLIIRARDGREVEHEFVSHELAMAHVAELKRQLAITIELKTYDAPGGGHPTVAVYEEKGRTAEYTPQK